MTSKRSDPQFDIMPMLERPTYTTAEAARLIGLKPSRIGRWLKGYNYPGINSDGKTITRKAEPVIGSRSNAATTYASFLDLIDLQFVKQFLNRGFSLQYLRKALFDAAKILGTNHFARQIFFASGNKIFLQLKEAQKEGDEENDEAYIELLTAGQRVFPQVIKELGTRIVFDEATGFACRWHPKEGRNLIVVDPLISFGQPSVVGHGVTTANIYDLYQAENSKIEKVCSWMDMDKKKVEAAVQFEKYLAA